MTTMPTLYHYVHCPFCVRVRLAAGLLGIQYNSIVLPYNDEKTPVELAGKKMLPIWQSADFTSNESLDIIANLDTENQLNVNQYKESNKPALIDPLLSKLGSSIHSLVMPYWMWTPEFNESSRLYFQSKKEVKRGPFKELVKNAEKFKLPLNEYLNDVENLIENESMLIKILIASHIWGLYVLPEFQFTAKLHEQLQEIKSQCHFNYHEDFWN
jgi:glutaredoxin 2